MNKINYETGRDYGAAQVLEITFNSAADDFADVSAHFVDAVRGISGTVTIFGYQANPQNVGAAVLREYDAGRYQ